MSKTPEFEVIKTPQEILTKVFNAGVDANSDVGALEPWDVLSPEEALRQLHALIRGEVIGEPVDFPHDSQVGAPIGTDGFIGLGRNYEKDDANKRNDRLFGIEGGPDGDSKASSEASSPLTKGGA